KYGQPRSRSNVAPRAISRARVNPAFPTDMRRSGRSTHALDSAQAGHREAHPGEARQSRCAVGGGGHVVVRARLGPRGLAANLVVDDRDAGLAAWPAAPVGLAGPASGEPGAHG